MTNSRCVADTPLEELTLAVLDFETTGLSPAADRVVEVACLRVAPDGAVESELHTLVDPRGPVGPTQIHGITQADVRGAPRFEDVADALMSQLDGAVVVAHNASFDVSFLEAEFARAGVTLPQLPYVCTMRLRRMIDLPGPSAHKLTWACWQEGIPIENAHAAVCDARAAGGLITRYVEHAGECEMKKLADCGGRGKSVDSWQHTPPRLAGRGRGVRLRQRSGMNGCPVNLLEDPGASQADLDAYSVLLGSSAADFHIDEGEVAELHALVGRRGLSSRQVRAVHEAHLRALLDDRLADGILTWAEEQEVRSFGRLLGVADRRVEQLLDEAGAIATIEGKPALTSPDQAAGAGIVVCFTGAFTAIPMTREEVGDLAAQAGMTPAKSVSKKVELVVCQDPASGSGKLRRAEELGTPVIDQQTFLAIAGVEPDTGDRARSVLERIEQRRLAAAEAQEQKRAATAEKARERARARAAETRKNGADGATAAASEQRLWCESGQHEWTRPAKRGRPPRSCPEHC